MTAFYALNGLNEVIGRLELIDHEQPKGDE